MPKVNKHTQELFKYIFYAPEEMQKKYYNGFAREIIYRPDVYKEDGNVKKNSIGKIIVQEKKEKNIDWYRYRNNKGDCIFNGIMYLNSFLVCTITFSLFFPVYSTPKALLLFIFPTISLYCSCSSSSKNLLSTCFKTVYFLEFMYRCDDWLIIF